VGDWFDYYKRAITWMDCEQWQNAESDLLAAIRVRSQDKRRVYTSGMHFLNNYFPNRELGVTLYYQQKYDAAVDALLRSFEQFPSEKARLFLQLALRKSAQYQQADQQAPKITKTQETTDFIYLTLSDDVYVDRLMVNGQSSVVIDNTTITFEPLSNAIDIVLDKNAYRGQALALTLIDVLEKQTPLILGVSLDITPPVISVTGKSQNGGQTQWQFSATDHQSDITSITVDGNVAQQSFINAMPEDLMLDVEMASQVTQENQVLLSIFMQSPKGLRQVSINNEIIPLQGQSETFLNYLFSLQSGVNNINIALSDGSETQYFSGAVMKELPEGFSLNNRLKLAVFPFDCEQNKTASCWENNQVFDSYFSEFSQRRRFQVVSRNNLGERVQQLKLCEFDLSEKCAWEATQLTGSQAMLVAEQTLRTTNNITTVEIYAKIIDASSGEILITFDTYQQLDDHSLDSRYLANKIHSYFPLLDFSLDGDKVSVNNSSFVPWHKMPMVGHQAPSSEEPCFIGKLVSKGNTLTLASAPSCQLQQLQNL
jgi:TolB-like protein